MKIAVSFQAGESKIATSWAGSWIAHVVIAAGTRGTEAIAAGVRARALIFAVTRA